jgi:hypothetical protein
MGDDEVVRDYENGMGILLFRRVVY